MLNNHSLTKGTKRSPYFDPNFLPGFYGIFNSSSQYCFLNEIAINWLGLFGGEYNGYTHLDIKCKASEIAPEWIEQEKMMLKENIYHVKFLGYQCYYKDKWRLVLGEKKIISCNNQQYFVCYITDITNYNLVDISSFFMETRCHGKFFKKQFWYEIRERPLYLNFTRRQSECLFYLVRGKSLKQIADILRISQKTVEEHIDKVKNSIGVFSKNSLIEKLIDAGFMNFIPESLFQAHFKTD